MVKIEYNDSELQKIRILSEFRDYLLQIYVLGGFFLGIWIITFIMLFQSGEFPKFMLVWIIVFIILITYFFIPTARLTIDLKQNLWTFHRLLLYIPFSRFAGKISQIKKYIITEQIENSNSKSSFGIQKRKYFSSFQFEFYPEKDAITENLVMFSRKTYDSASHEKNMKRVTKIGLELRKIFRNLQIPFDLEYEQS